ncbi:MAG TPA: LamG domain-containing protein [Verrucomicrobiae bacterium]|nr:LamG domain-containing protein [Verrucomicrobiae bacterium]
MKIKTFGRPCPKLFITCIALSLLTGFTCCSQAQNLLAHWTLDVPQGTTWPDSSTNQCFLYQDTNTTPAALEPGIAGYSVYLNWAPDPGTSTRLYATNAALQTDSFGFSFWIQPVYLNDFDNFIIKESGAYDYGDAGYAAMAWQVHMLGNNGSGAAPIEFIVRGQNGGFYGVVQSSTNLALYTGYTNWVHIAGGYDATTGDLSLFVNGVESDASGNPGAYNSDGSPFDIGTAANGLNYIAFAAGTYIDDVQLYDSPLTASNVDFLMANPGAALGTVINTPVIINPFNYNAASGDMTIVFNSASNQNYAVQVSTDLLNWSTVTNLTADSSSTTNVISQDLVNGVLGSAPRTQLFIRIQSQ